MSLIVTICVVGVLIPSTHAQNTKEVLDKVNSGIDAGNTILDILSKQKESKYFKQIGEVAEKISPFLGVIGPVIEIVTLFLPESPSLELTLMKQEFAKFDAKFDQVFDQFEQVKNLMKEESLKIQYSEYALSIIHLSKRLQDFLEQPVENADIFKQKFIESYENTDGEATLTLIEGMTGGTVITDNIPLAAIEFTDNHRRKTQEVMAGVLGLIIQGIKVDLAYHKLKGEEEAYVSWKDYFEKEIRRVINFVMQMDFIVKDKWYGELSVNIDSQLAALHDKSNEEFAGALYSFLTDKYDWRDWLVVAYKDLFGGDKHWSSACGGYHRFRQHGRNLIVASVDQSKNHIDIDNALGILRDVTTRRCKSDWWAGEKCWDLQAKEVFELLPAEMIEGCTYASVGVIEKDADISYQAPPDRFINVENNKYKIHAFG